MLSKTSAGIAAELRAQIKSGGFKPGEKLPTMKDLMEDHGISKSTARKVLTSLKDEGLATYRAGRNMGTFVRRPPVDRMIRSRKMERDEMGYYSGKDVQHWRQVPGTSTVVGHRPAPPDIARLLGVEPGTFVYTRERFVGDPDRPEHRQAADSWLHPELVEAIPAVMGNTGLGGVYDRVEEWAEGPISWEEEVTAAIPSPEESKTLLLPSGVALLRLLRTSTVKKGRREITVEVQEIRMSADLFSVKYPVMRRGDAKWPVRPAGQDFYSG
jgi:GntR family transcriptional regulator